MFKDMETLVKYAKEKGFVYPGFEIYDGLANTWDFGPLGTKLRINIINQWRKTFILAQDANFEIQTPILTKSSVLEASGHVGGFNDPLIDCKQCKERFRADKLIEQAIEGIKTEGKSNAELEEIIKQNHILCPNCQQFDYTEIREFELMFDTNMGVLRNAKSKVYLRPETAQGIFINFKNVARTQRLNLPFGIAQVGKSFRNEITPGNFIFRQREFEQMELEFFTNPNEAAKWFAYYEKLSFDFLKSVGICEDNIELVQLDEEELAHYSSQTTDIFYKFPFGNSELLGIANRGDYDLKKHMEHSNEDLRLIDPNTNEKVLAHTIEPSIGVDRLMLALFNESFKNDGEREYLSFNDKIAPIKVAFLPLTKKLSVETKQLFDKYKVLFDCIFEEKANIGKRYKRCDELGVRLCVTFDFDSLEDNMVTLRDIETTEQKRISFDELEQILYKKFI